MFKFAKLVSVIAVFTLVLTLSASAFAENTTDDPAAPLAEYNQIMEATEDYISNMFSVERRTQETISIIQANQIISKLGDSDIFGGQYLDSDGKLHVIVTSNDAVGMVKECAKLDSATLNRIMESTQSDYVTAFDSSDVVIEQGSYSKNELDNIVSHIYANNDKAEYVYGYYVDESKNVVVVELKENSKDEIFKFKQNISDSPAIEFEKSDGIGQPKATLYAGTVVYPTSSSRVTITGFGYKNNKLGLVTVGHILGNTIRTSSSGSIIGTTLASNKVINASADGSWTEINSGHTANNGTAKVGSSQTNYAYMLTGHGFDPVQGASVVSYLGVTGAVKSGTIEALNWGHPMDYSQQGLGVITCYDIKVNISSNAGDSGSPLISVAHKPELGLPTLLWGGLRGGINPTNGYSNIHSINSALSIIMAAG